MKLHHLVSAAVLALGFVAGAHASTTILDISATTGVPVQQTFAAGHYTVNWIDNTAKGGYNGWIYNTANTYREAFTISGLPVGTVSVDKSSSIPGSNSRFAEYATAALALAAAQSGPYAVYSNATDGSVTYSIGSVVFDLATATKLTFSIPDLNLSDNCCGVSVAISNGVPEPGSYPLALAGIGALALISRRRKSV